jgi:hypothetical protein
MHAWSCMIHIHTHTYIRICIQTYTLICEQLHHPTPCVYIYSTERTTQTANQGRSETPSTTSQALSDVEPPNNGRYFYSTVSQALSDVEPPNNGRYFYSTVSQVVSDVEPPNNGRYSYSTVSQALSDVEPPNNGRYSYESFPQLQGTPGPALELEVWGEERVWEEGSYVYNFKKGWWCPLMRMYGHIHVRRLYLYSYIFIAADGDIHFDTVYLHIECVVFIGTSIQRVCSLWTHVYRECVFSLYRSVSLCTDVSTLTRCIDLPINSTLLFVSIYIESECGHMFIERRTYIERVNTLQSMTHCCWLAYLH